MKLYSTPTIIDLGSIAETTFATPNNGGMHPNNPNFIPAVQLGDGNYACGPTAGSNGVGGKNYLVLQCDKFGEYSHS